MEQPAVQTELIHILVSFSLPCGSFTHTRPDSLLVLTVFALPEVRNTFAISPLVRPYNLDQRQSNEFHNEQPIWNCRSRTESIERVSVSLNCVFTIRWYYTWVSVNLWNSISSTTTTTKSGLELSSSFWLDHELLFPNYNASFMYFQFL